MESNSRYLCIHCKLAVNVLPPFRSNECPFGHDHAFIKRSAIISRDKRDELVQAYELGKKIGKAIKC